MPQNPNKRLHYFDHQFLRADDFTAEQEYHVGRRRLHNRALHTWGIAEGLDLTFDSGSGAVTVQQGTAIDADGNEIVLTEDRRVDLGAHPEGASAYITIEYRETPTDLSKETDIHDNTRWTEDPDVRALADRPPRPSMQLILGRVNRSGRVVSDVDRSDRRAAGAVSGDITTSALTLKHERVDPATWPRLVCSGSFEAALENGSLGLGAGRELLFAGEGRARSQGPFRVFAGPDGAERLTVSADGRVGVGTSTPLSARLEIDTAGGAGSSLRCEHRTSNFVVRPMNAGGSATVIENTAGMLLINPGGGNVGVGAGAAGEKLQVEGGSIFVSGDGAGVIVDAGGKRIGLMKYAGREAGIWRTAKQDFEIGRVNPEVGALPGKPTSFTTDLYVSGAGSVGVGTTDLGDAKLKIASSAADFASFRFARPGGGELEFVSWEQGWNINARAKDRSLHVNRDAEEGSNVLIGRNKRELFVRGKDGFVGVLTNNPSHPLHVEDDLGLRVNRLYLSGGHRSKWSSISYNAYHNTTNNEWVFPDKASSAVTIEMDDVGNNPRFEVYTTKPGATATWEFRFGVYAGKTRVHGDLEVTGGLHVHKHKVGYVVDQFVNNLGETLELGDVVVVGRNQTGLYYGTANNIPIPEVDLTETAHDTRVCGIVCEVFGKLREEEPAAAGPKGRGAKKAADKGARPAGLQAEPLSDEEMAATDLYKVEPGQTGLLVTLGAFAHCKVDADIAPVEVGDLLTTSTTRGHAQKVTDPAAAAGAILGKALGALKKGRGVIPVLVTLH